MTPFSFLTASEIRFGRGEAMRSVARIVELANNKPVLLIGGQSAKRSDWLATALTECGCDVRRMSVDVEPDLNVIERGLSAGDGVGAVVALGGGSVIDAGKAIAALIPAKRPIMDHLEVVGRGLPLDVAPLPFVAITTTSGTGAEVTKNAVISVPAHRRKVSLRDARMLPDLAVVDPSLTDHCPKQITLTSGLDAITQVIEPYLCTKANPFTDALCRDAIPRGLRALNILMQHEDEAARDELAYVSLCGGIALANAGLGVIHGLAGPLGGLTGAAHGALCGALLPHGLEVNAFAVTDDHFGSRIEDVRQWIARELGRTPESAFETLAAWSRSHGLQGLDELGLCDADLKDAAHAASTSSSMKANPVVLSYDNLAQILKAAR
ncbi:MAG: iron-containing alcohol dehydrogenase [Celeribacter marinus]